MTKTRTQIWLGNLISRKNILLIILFVLFILFREGIWDTYNQKVVSGMLAKIKSHWLLDIVLFALIIFTLIITIHLFMIKKRVTNSFFCTSLFLFILFGYCRAFSGKYSFEAYYWFPSSKYIDYLFLIFGCLVIIKIWNWLSLDTEPNYKDIPFLIDKPVGTSGVDKFGRKAFAKKIAEKIQSKLKDDKAGSLAIGINGVWGSGKTSFINMIKGAIDESNRIIIDFNSWRSASATKIIEDFFELLIAELKPYDPSLSNNLSNYAKSLTKIDEGVLSKSVDVVLDLFEEDKSKNEIYDYINESIKKIKRQIIIFIDDLDRLDKKEIIEVLRIIRNTANFNNVVYVVSYDKSYVLTAIEDFNKYNYKSFLEKIFQFEFSLPMYEHGVLRNEIKILLKEGLEPNLHKQIDRVVDSREFYGINFTNEIIKTYRDVIRLVNSLLFEIDTIKEETFFYDFYLLQLLKLQFPKVHEGLIDNRYLFFTTDGENGIYRFKTVDEAWTGDDELFFNLAFKNNSYTTTNTNEGKSKLCIEMFLDENENELDLTGYDKSLIIHLLKTLIKLKEGNQESDDRELYKSFAYPANFHKYFAFRLYEGDISAKEFEEFRQKDFASFKRKILEWVDEGKYSLLIDRLEKVQDFSSITEFENHVLILFELGRLQSSDNLKNPYAMDHSIILRSLEYPTKRGTLKVYANKEDYRKFIMKTLHESPKPRIYESHLIARLIGGPIDFVFTRAELSDINFEFFKEYCDNNERITFEFSQLHNNAIEPTSSLSQPYKIRDDAEELYRSYSRENITACELSGIIRQSSPGQEYYYIDKDWPFKIFASWEGFEIFLESSEKIKKEVNCYKEFLKYYEKTKGNNYGAVEFPFEYLEVYKYD